MRRQAEVWEEYRRTGLALQPSAELVKAEVRALGYEVVDHQAAYEARKRKREESRATESRRRGDNDGATEPGSGSRG